jgi:hypothetical protein
MIVYDKKLPYVSKQKRFYRKIVESRKTTEISQLYLFETDHLQYNDPILDIPDEFAIQFKRFLINIGKYRQNLKKLFQ